jgi:hypothetical protein
MPETFRRAGRVFLISETRRRLKEWGLWACGGEPQLSSMFRSMFGRGAQDLREMPPHISEIDHIICIAPRDIRAILIKFYGQGGTIQDKAISAGMDRRTFRRRVERGEWFVNSELDRLPAKTHLPPQNAVPRRETPRISRDPIPA